MDVVVGIVFDLYVAVVPREDAVQVRAIKEALYSSSSWAEAREKLVPVDPEFLDGRLDPDEDPDDYDYDPVGVLGESWPPPALGITEEVVPAELAQRWGDVDRANPSGSWLQIDAEHLDGVVSDLQALGWSVTVDHGLVQELILD